MSTSSFLFERVVIAAPLAVRFWDGVIGEFVRDGLSVVAYPADQPRRRTAGYAAGSGTFAFRNLPGLGRFERSVGTDDPWTPPPPSRPIVIEMTDSARRFLPSRFAVGVPDSSFAAPGCLPADLPAGAVPLYSDPGRVAPGSFAMMRAELWDPMAGAPAPWAVVEARAGGVLIGRGVSDASGKVLVMGPYPAPPDVAFGSPAAVPTPLASQTWTVSLEARYSPSSPLTAGGVPDLCDVLGQAPAALWATPALNAPFSGASLAFGRDLVARSFDPAAGRDMPVLLITAMGSPP